MNIPGITITHSTHLIRWLLLASYLGLLAVFVVWYAGDSLTGLLLAGLPLVILLPGCWFMQRTPLALGGFLALAYFAHGITELVANPARHHLALLELLLATVMLVCCSWLLRWRSVNRLSR
ncbi:MAG TPA: DUF2069 domain-containing protein [Gammaproteobacteria bacterium]|nr:DUF2069 domain-containing protein [Gammaproteobacteria bacterium]